MGVQGRPHTQPSRTIPVLEREQGFHLRAHQNVGESYRPDGVHDGMDQRWSQNSRKNDSPKRRPSQIVAAFEEHEGVLGGALFHAMIHSVSVAHGFESMTHANGLKQDDPCFLVGWARANRRLSCSSRKDQVFVRPAWPKLKKPQE